MKYRSISDMASLIRENLHLVPEDVDLIVGVPRSGILPAITIALLLNLRYADLDNLCEGRLSGTGSTKPGSRLIADLREAKHVLVIDDSLNRGYAMKEVRARLAQAGVGAKVSLCAIYVVPGGEAEVDVAFEVVPLPRIFEWNLPHHLYMQRTCMSIEGVLCRSPLPAEGAGAAAYARFLDETQPLMRPTQRIACLLSAQSEQHRAEVEAWLARHGILHERLVMLDLPADPGGAALVKARFYGASPHMLFIEGDDEQSAAIAQISGKPVLSMERQDIVSPAAWSGTAALQKLRGLRSHAEMSDSPLLGKEAFKRKLRRVMRPKAYGFALRLIARLRGKPRPQEEQAAPVAITLPAPTLRTAATAPTAVERSAVPQAQAQAQAQVLTRQGVEL